MSDYELDDELLIAVRAARPAIPAQTLAPAGQDARAVLDRVLASERRWRPPNLGALVAVLAVAVSVAVAILALTQVKHQHQQPASALRPPTVALNRAAAAAVAGVQSAFGPGKFWYLRTVQSTDGPLSFGAYRSTVETWFGFDGTSRTRSGSPAASVSGQDTVSVGDPDYGPGDGVGLSQALLTGAQLSSLPTVSGQLRAAIDAGDRALDRQEHALKIQVRRTPGSEVSQMVLRSKLTASQQRSLDMFDTAASLLAGPVSPGVRGALYRLIATLPGLRYDGELRDALGRLGAAVSIGRGRNGARITFDPATGELLSYELDGVLTQTIAAEGFTSSLASVPSGLTAVGGQAPPVLLATVSPHVGAALTVFHVVQSTRNAPMQDMLQGPTAADCKAELFPGPSPQLSGGARTIVALDGLRALSYRYSFGPASIGRRVWCPGQYELQIIGVNGSQATDYFDVK